MELEPSLGAIVETTSLKWIFVGGKGGVGKTTTAASLSTLLAEHRDSVLIISTDPAHNLSDAFNQQLSDTPTQIEGVPNLYAMEVKPKIRTDSLELPEVLGMESDQATRDLLGEIVNSIPGIDEAMSFSELLRMVQNMTFDIVVFDTAPTGHTMRLLNFPTILDKGLAKIVSLKQSLGSLMTQMSSLMGRADNFYDSAFEKLEQMKEVIEIVRKQFQDPSITTFVAVCIPEFLSIYETERLVVELANFNIDIGHIVVNQVLYPEDECRMCKAREGMQKKYLEQIYDMYDDFHIVKTPLLDEEVRGIDRLRTFSRFLMGYK